MSVSIPSSARQLTGLFSVAYGRYCAALAASLAPTVAAAPLPSVLGGLIAAYLTPDRCEFSQLALTPAMDGDREFADWLLEWDGCNLTLTHPVREYSGGMSSFDGDDSDSTDNFVYEDELDDLPSLAARVYDPSIDEVSPAELSALLADLLEYRFESLAEKPLPDVWRRLAALDP